MSTEKSTLPIMREEASGQLSHGPQSSATLTNDEDGPSGNNNNNHGSKMHVVEYGNSSLDLSPNRYRKNVTLAGKRPERISRVSFQSSSINTDTLTRQVSSLPYHNDSVIHRSSS